MNYCNTLLSYTRASSALSVSSIRQQFSNKENIQVIIHHWFRLHFPVALKRPAQMSLFSAGFIKDAKGWGLIGDDIQFWEGGYLFLATKDREGILKRNTALQRELGASINLMSASYFNLHHIKPPRCFVSHALRAGPPPTFAASFLG